MSLAIIGAGQGRTGTKTLQLALEELGFGPCYHGGDQVYRDRSPGWRLWLRAFRRENVDWDELFHGYRVTVDSPGCLFYRELCEAYPSARVILTVRDADSWFESVRTTFLAPHLIGHFKRTLGREEFELFEREHSDLFGTHRDRKSAIAAYERHNAEVRRSVDPSRLLVYDVTQGWNPLCSFLGVGVPTASFPHAHARTESQRSSSPTFRDSTT